MQPNLSMTVSPKCERHITSETAMRTEAIGAALGAILAPGDVLCLSGELGAGKTVLSRGIGAGWGATVPLSSPTYNLVHEHERSADNTRLYHLDFYRIRARAKPKRWVSKISWIAAMSSYSNGPSGFWTYCQRSACGLTSRCVQMIRAAWGSSRGASATER